MNSGPKNGQIKCNKQPMEGRPNAYNHFRSAGKAWGLTNHHRTRKQCDRLMDKRPDDCAINRPGPQPLGYWKRATQS